MDQYRVFGNPIAQSKSPFIHQHFAHQTDQQLNYESELVEVGGFAQAVHQLIKNNGKGANVTAPFKEEAFALCDELSTRAKLSGAVNTLVFKNGLIYGDTTDGIGLVGDLIRHHIQLTGASILLLGAGGAAKGVVQSLLEQNPKSLTIANRTISKAEAIIEQYRNEPIQACTFEQASTESYDIIINATSAGLSGDNIPISEDVIRQANTCYDMVYGKEPTPFLKTAQKLAVVHVIDGLGMLVGQAAESFNIWRNVMPDVTPVLKTLRHTLE